MKLSLVHEEDALFDLADLPEAEEAGAALDIPDEGGVI